MIFVMISGVASAQLFDFSSESGFCVNGFAELGLVLQMAFAADGGNDYFATDADLFNVALQFGAQSFTPTAAIYPYVNLLVWEDGDQYISVFFRVRMRWGGTGWKQSVTTTTTDPFRIESYGASITWQFSETAYLDLYNGNLHIETFGTEVYYAGTIGLPTVSLGFDLEMMQLAISLAGPFGLDQYGIGPWVDFNGPTGFTAGDDLTPYHLWININNIDLDIMNLSVGIGYEFYNTYTYDATIYAGLDAEDTLGIAGTVYGSLPVWANIVPEKGGALLFSLDFGLTMEGLIAVGLYEELFYGLTTGSFFNDVVLDISLLLVDGLTVNLWTEFYFDMVLGNSDIDGYEIGATGMGFWFPAWLYVSYDLDLGGMSLSPYLFAGADLGGLLMGETGRGWFLSVGANLGLGGGYIRVPFEIMITNAPNEGWVAGTTTNYLTTAYIYGGGESGLQAVVYITLGIIFELD
jgi:hypothetical protein